MIGIGVGLGVSSSTNISPEWLISAMQQIHGVNLTGGWLGDDLLGAVGANAESIPARVGPTLARFGAVPQKIGMQNGRKALNPNNTGLTCYYTSDAIFKTAIIITTGSPCLVNGETWLLNQENGSPICRRFNASDLFYSSPWTHYVNGVPTEAIPTMGKMIVECVNAASTTTALSCGGYINQNWPAPTMISGIFRFANTLTSETRQSTLTLLNRFWPS